MPRTIGSTTWTTGLLGDLLTLQRGFDITSRDYSEGNVPVIASSGIVGWCSEPRVQGPGVVIGRKGTLGKVHYVDGPYWPSDTTLWVRDFKGNDRRFLYYFLRGLRVTHLDVGSANPTLNRNHLHAMPVRWPGVAEQRRIAGALAALDDLIEVNQALIGNLIQASRAVVLRHLSGPFEPLSSILDLRRGVGYRSVDFSESTGIPSISMGASSSSGLLKRAKIRLLDRDVPNRYLVEPYDIVMANVDLTWDFGILAWPVVVPEYLGSSVAITSDMYGLRLRTEHADLGIAVWAQLMDDRFRDWVASCAKGTTVASIAQRDVLQFEVRTGVSEAARVAAREMLRLVWSLEEENLSLHQSRNEILPLLMSGRVHVGNVAA